MANGDDKSTERFQIAILTFFMTAGGFFLVFLFFQYHLNVNAHTAMQSAEKSYNELKKICADPNVKILRQTEKESEGVENDKGLQDVILSSLSSFGLKYTNLGDVKRSAAGRRTPQKGGGLQEIKLSLDIEPAPLRPLQQFVAAVEESKKTVYVDNVEFRRNRRVKAEEDSWTCSVTFVDLVSRKP